MPGNDADVDSAPGEASPAQVVQAPREQGLRSGTEQRHDTRIGFGHVLVTASICTAAPDSGFCLAIPATSVTSQFAP